MKNMPGMKEMMSKMGMGGGGGKMNMGALQANLERSMKSASQKDRLRAKLAANQLAKSIATATTDTITITITKTNTISR